MKYILFIIAAFTFTNLNAQDKKAYQLFDKKGKKVTFDKVIKETLKTEVVLFGEFHNNPICHWLQLELTKEIAAKRQVVLGAEMIEADNQMQLNDYLSGKINKYFDITIVIILAILLKSYSLMYSFRLEDLLVDNLSIIA